jgi:hypothetical protein
MSDQRERARTAGGDGRPHYGIFGTKRVTSFLCRTWSKRIYAPRIVADHIMMQEDFERLHKWLAYYA